MLPEDVETFLVKIKVEGSISRQSTTFSEIFIFQWNLPLMLLHSINLRLGAIALGGYALQNSSIERSALELTSIGK